MYRRTLKALSEQVDFKIKSGSNIRLKLDYQNKDFNKLTTSIEKLFMSVDKEKYLVKQERRTLDMAISNISHDIRTPLTVSRGYTQKLLRDEKMDLVALKKIEDNLVTASNRLEMLLEYRRILENSIQPKQEKINLKEVILSELLPLYDAFNEKDFEVELNMDEVYIESDKEILGRIFQNIFGNVLKHGKESLSVLLSTKAKNVVVIKNISKNKIEHLDRLTSRFYSENMSQNEESSGLGLFIVEELVQALGGKMELFYEDEEFSIKMYL